MIDNRDAIAGTAGNLAAQLAGLPEEYPVLFHLDVRQWFGKYLFNPKVVSYAGDRVRIELVNGHCVNKINKLFCRRLADIPVTAPVDVAVQPFGLLYRAPELNAEFVADEMLIRITTTAEPQKKDGY